MVICANIINFKQISNTVLFSSAHYGGYGKKGKKEHCYAAGNISVPDKWRYL